MPTISSTRHATQATQTAQAPTVSPSQLTGVRLTELAAQLHASAVTVPDSVKQPAVQAATGVTAPQAGLAALPEGEYAMKLGRSSDGSYWRADNSYVPRTNHQSEDVRLMKKDGKLYVTDGSIAALSGHAQAFNNIVTMKDSRGQERGWLQLDATGRGVGSFREPRNPYTSPNGMGHLFSASASYDGHKLVVSFASAASGGMPHSVGPAYTGTLDVGSR